MYYGNEILSLIAKDIKRQEEERGVKISNAKAMKAFYASFEIPFKARVGKMLSFKSCEKIFGEIMEKIRGKW